MPTTPTPDDDAPARAELISLALADIRPDPANPRASLGDLSGLAASIAERGVLQPITVAPIPAPTRRGARWQVVAGHRRLAAAAEAGHASIPAITRPDLTLDSTEQITAQIVENLHRADLLPLEEAAAYARLVETGRSQRAIAGDVGVTQAHVSRRLKLLALPVDVRDDINSGTLTIGDGLELARLVDHPRHLGRAHRQLTHGTAAAEAVAQELLVIERTNRVEATLAALRAEGIEIVRWPKGGIYGTTWKPLHTAAAALHDELGNDPHTPYELIQVLAQDRFHCHQDLATVTADGLHAATVTPTGHRLDVCTNPAHYRPPDGTTDRPTGTDNSEDARRAAAEAAQAARQAREAEAHAARRWAIDHGLVTSRRGHTPKAAAGETRVQLGDSLVRLLCTVALDQAIDTGALADIDDDTARTEIHGALGLPDPDNPSHDQLISWARNIAPNMSTDRLIAATAAVLTGTTPDTWTWTGDDDPVVNAFTTWLTAHGHTPADQLATTGA